MTDQSSTSAGKSPLRKLGRGLGALLGAPVPVHVPTALEQPSIVLAGPTTRDTEIISAWIKERPVELGVPRGTFSTATTIESKPPADETPANELRQISVAAIHPNSRQPRVDFDEASLKLLADSIRSAGLMQPIVVRESINGFELVAGERRWRAAKLLGMTVIPALVKSISDQAAAELAIIENVHREDLNAMERACALRRLADEFSLTHAAVAERVGLDRVSVSNLLRLTELDSAVASLVRNGSLSQGHAKALLSIAMIEPRLAFAKQCVAAGWSVRELERRVAMCLSQISQISETTRSGGASPPRLAHVSDLERQLSAQLGTKVTIQLGRKKGSGRLIVDFFNLDQFDGVLAKLGVSQLES